MLEIQRFVDGIAFLKNGFEFAFYSVFTDTLRFSSEIHSLVGYDWNTITIIYATIENYKEKKTATV